MKHYTFTFTKKEAFQFSILTTRARIRQYSVLWILLLFLCILNALISQREGFMLLLWIFMLMLLFLLRIYLLQKKSSTGTGEPSGQKETC